MFILDSTQRKRLETPCIVLNAETVDKNIKNMQAAVHACGCDLRPHIKTHKMSRFARAQAEAGCAGITCAKVSEAEVMAQGGIKDIFIAYPLIGDFRIKRAMALYPQLDRLILAVDSIRGAKLLSEAAQNAGIIPEVRIEVDTGCKRTGVPGEEAVQLAKAVSALPNLNLTGIYTFKGLLYQGAATADRALAAREEGEMLARVAREMQNAGIEIREISAGSTPTALGAAQTGLVTEVRPGTYIFNDYMLYRQNACAFADIAGLLYCTVVSTPAPDYAVIDGGSKTFPMDITPGVAPYFYPGYATVLGADEKPDLNLQLRRLSEEHGIITAKNGETGLYVGQVIPLVPIHICPAINLQNQVYIFENGGLTVQKVDARGKLQ